MIAAEAQYRDWMLAGLAGDAAAYRDAAAGTDRPSAAPISPGGWAAAAEDLVQETLIAIHTRRATYDPALPFTAWVYGIARYKLIDEYRRDKRRATVPLDEAPTCSPMTRPKRPSPGAMWTNCWPGCPRPSASWCRTSSWKAFGGRGRQPRTGMSESAVKVTVHRAIKSLGEDLRAKDLHDGEDRNADR